MIINDEIVIAINICSPSIFIVDKKTKNGATVDAYDLENRKHTLKHVVVDPNEKVCLMKSGYYFYNNYLEPLYTKTNILDKFNLKKHDDVSIETLKQIEKYIKSANSEPYLYL